MHSIQMQGVDFHLRLCGVFRPVVASVFMALVAATGCGEARGPIGQVHGKVTFEGKPVASGAAVSFLAAGGGASGVVGADGSYRVVSTQGEGVAAGTYKVLVLPPGGSTPTPEEAMKASMSNGKGQAAAPSDPTIPEKYRSAATTPLSYEIKVGDNEINIELKTN